jgi:hypothetical protein
MKKLSSLEVRAVTMMKKSAPLSVPESEVDVENASVRKA